MKIIKESLSEKRLVEESLSFLTLSEILSRIDISELKKIIFNNKLDIMEISDVVEGIKEWFEKNNYDDYINEKDFYKVADFLIEVGFGKLYQ